MENYHYRSYYLHHHHLHSQTLRPPPQPPPFSHLYPPLFHSPSQIYSQSQLSHFSSFPSWPTLDPPPSHLPVAGYTPARDTFSDFREKLLKMQEDLIASREAILLESQNLKKLETNFLPSLSKEQSAASTSPPPPDLHRIPPPVTAPLRDPRSPPPALSLNTVSGEHDEKKKEIQVSHQAKPSSSPPPSREPPSRPLDIAPDENKEFEEESAAMPRHEPPQAPPWNQPRAPQLSPPPPSSDLASDKTKEKGEASSMPLHEPPMTFLSLPRALPWQPPPRPPDIVYGERDEGEVKNPSIFGCLGNTAMRYFEDIYKLEVLFKGIENNVGAEIPCEDATIILKDRGIRIVAKTWDDLVHSQVFMGSFKQSQPYEESTIRVPHNQPLLLQHVAIPTPHTNQQPLHYFLPGPTSIERHLKAKEIALPCPTAIHVYTSPLISHNNKFMVSIIFQPMKNSIFSTMKQHGSHSIYSGVQDFGSWDTYFFLGPNYVFEGNDNIDKDETPEKFISFELSHGFNLEDKVDFEGVGNDRRLRLIEIKIIIRSIWRKGI